MKIDKDVVIYYGLEVREPANISMVRGVIIGDNSILDGRNGTHIGEDVVLPVMYEYVRSSMTMKIRGSDVPHSIMD